MLPLQSNPSTLESKPLAQVWQWVHLFEQYERNGLLFVGPKSHFKGI